MLLNITLCSEVIWHQVILFKTSYCFVMLVFRKGCSRCFSLRPAKNVGSKVSYSKIKNGYQEKLILLPWLICLLSHLGACMSFSSRKSSITPAPGLLLLIAMIVWKQTKHHACCSLERQLWDTQRNWLKLQLSEKVAVQLKEQGVGDGHVQASLTQTGFWEGHFGVIVG